MVLNLENLTDLRNAIDDVIGYVTDNSCSDPECCGGPYYTDEDYTKGLDILSQYNLYYEKE